MTTSLHIYIFLFISACNIIYLLAKRHNNKKQQQINKMTLKEQEQLYKEHQMKSQTYPIA